MWLRSMRKKVVEMWREREILLWEKCCEVGCCCVVMDNF